MPACRGILSRCTDTTSVVLVFSGEMRNARKLKSGEETEACPEEEPHLPVDLVKRN